ncbi:MAG: peptidase and matrixin and adamalysin [Frankiales bacterium]|nr:peptidase and matrixin and adamalysin [Frankiales bacterium]
MPLSPFSPALPSAVPAAASGRPRARLRRAVAVTAAGLTLAAAPATGRVLQTAPETVLTDTAAAQVGTAAVVPGKSYAFAAVLGGRPVRWDPCRTMHWRSNTRLAPAGALAVLKSAVAQVAAATGTRWVYDGPTTSLPRLAALRTSSTAPQPVLIGWADRASSDLLAGQTARTAGIARTRYLVARSSAGSVAVTRGAVVALNRASRLPLRGASSWQAVATHELAHVMGLAHASAGNQLMSVVLPARVTSLQAGDRAGLARLGRAAGCVPFAG